MDGKLFFVREIDFNEWNLYFKECHKTNMLQCWQYGEAKKQSENVDVVRFVIMDQNNVAIGLAQFLIRDIPFIGGVARLNRGPIIIKNYKVKNEQTLLIEIVRALLIESKKRRWWLVRFAPEIYNSRFIDKSLKELGLKKMSLPPFASGLIDLKFNEDELLMRLKKKWRYCLRKGELNKISTIPTTENNHNIEVLLKNYNLLQKKQKFVGISSSLIKSLAKQKSVDWEFSLLISDEFNVKNPNSPLAMLVYIRHGDTATYLIGITTNEGKSLNINYALLWRAILRAKKDGCKWFDIGGLNSTTPEGIRHFKKGLNSELYDLTGEWKAILTPWSNIT